MKHEFHAQFPLALQDSVLQAFSISFLSGKDAEPPHHWQDLSHISDDAARISLLAQAIVTGRKDEARVGSGKDSDGLGFWLTHHSDAFFSERIKMMQNLQILPEPPDLIKLPQGSWLLHFNFILCKPYLSKDDMALHLLDNPMKKEWVFKLPYVASTQWKGTLHAVMLKQLVEWWQDLTQDQQLQRIQRKQFVARRIQLTRLFGTEIGNTQNHLKQCGDDKLDNWYRRYVRRYLSDTRFFTGRLYFYPSFFDRLSLEVINPHNRETGAGSLPIYFEVVPSGTRGNFTLLYTPLDRIGKEEDKTRRQVIADMELVAEGLEALFTMYGFGAKTSSGFGLANDAVENGSLVLNWPGFVFPQTETGQVQQPEDTFLKYMDESGHSKSDFSGTGDFGLMSNSDFKEKGEKSGGGSLSEFKAFRRWYGEHSEQWQKSLKEKISGANFPQISFERLSQLAEMMRQAGGDV